MKELTVQALVTSRSLLNQAEHQIALGDRYGATAGLIVLQDAVELVFLAALIQLGVDEKKKLEDLTFDQMIGELGAAKIRVPKSGTLKAMNKLRVTAKHYGQLMDPVTVQGHLNASKFAIDAVLQLVVNKNLRDVYLTELLPVAESRNLLEQACAEYDENNYLQALISIRKAFFIEFESDYCIYPYRGEQKNMLSGLLGLTLAGIKAPYWTKKSDWITANVKTPYDYIQIDFEQFKLDAIEWGINTQVLNNLRRLTPNVIRLAYDGDWLVRFNASFPANMATKENAGYCLDNAIDAVRRKSEHKRITRYAASDKSHDYPTAYVGQSLYLAPKLDSTVVRTLEEDDRYTVKEIMHGFDATSIFYRITCTNTANETFEGFLQMLDERLEGTPVDF